MIDRKKRNKYITFCISGILKNNGKIMIVTFCSK